MLYLLPYFLRLQKTMNTSRPRTTRIATTMAALTENAAIVAPCVVPSPLLVAWEMSLFLGTRYVLELRTLCLVVLELQTICLVALIASVYSKDRTQQ